MDADPPAPAAVPPPVPASALTEPDTSPPPTPWGFWLTIAFCFSIAVVDIIAQTVIVLGFALAEGKLEDARALEEFAYNGLVLSSGTLFCLPIVVGLCVMFAAVRPGIRVIDYLALRPARWKPTLLSLLAIILFGVLYSFVDAWAGRPALPDFMIDVYHSAGFMPLLWLAVVVAAPIGEEVFFRGFLFAGIAKSPIGGWGAILLTSLAWAAIHVQYDLWDISYIFLLGLIIGTFRLKTNSLWPPILMHALVNLVAMIQTAVVLGGSNA